MDLHVLGTFSYNSSVLSQSLEFTQVAFVLFTLTVMEIPFLPSGQVLSCPCPFAPLSPLFSCPLYLISPFLTGLLHLPLGIRSIPPVSLVTGLLSGHSHGPDECFGGAASRLAEGVRMPGPVALLGFAEAPATVWKSRVFCGRRRMREEQAGEESFYREIPAQ